MSRLEKFFNFGVVLALTACQFIDSVGQERPTNYTHQEMPASIVPTPTSAEQGSLVVSRSDNDVVDFGWLPDGRIYYGIGDPFAYGRNMLNAFDQIEWFAYDSSNGALQKIESPYPELDAEFLDTLSQDGEVDILSMTLSPTGENVLYSRLPAGYVRPTPSPHYFDPSEIWVALNRGEAIFPLLNRPKNWYDCGFALGAVSRWFDNETRVLGSCQFTYGITQVYFWADLSERKIQFLDFETEEGEYVPSEQIAIAHDDPSLTFSQEGFWVVPLETRQREVSTTLTDTNSLSNGHQAVSPQWSSDDQWIYYWTSDTAKVNQGEIGGYRLWWLEKINVSTKQREIVLSPAQLSSAIGTDMYEMGTPLGFGNPWRLSSDGNRFLMFINKTVKNPAALFLISW